LTPCEADELYDRQSRERDPGKRKLLVWEFERRVRDEMAHTPVILGNVRAVAHWDYLKGLKVTPSLYLNQDLATVWLAP
jgi:peptide/nickel transport system substrate-binding protein